MGEAQRLNAFYATVIDRNYVPLGLNLYRSFEGYLHNKIFGFFCIDDEASELLRSFDLPNSRVFAPDDFETLELRRLKTERAINEYCWTLKPTALQTGFTLDPSVEWGIYLDSDMMVFADPDLALPSDGSVVLAPHRFATAEFAACEPSVGRFNGGHAAFRNNQDGNAALAWWHERCLEACPAIPTATAYADQKYLDALPKSFRGICESANKGLNAAPWNVQGFSISERNSLIFVDDDQLLLFHFQGLKIFGTRLYDLYAGPMRLPAAARRLIYRPYILSLRTTFDLLKQQVPEYRSSLPRFTVRNAFNQARRLLRGECNLGYA